jgi:hypothetical protein
MPNSEGNAIAVPYNPEAHFDIGGSVRAGQQLVSPLQEALQKYEGERKKSMFNQGVFDIMKDKTDSSGKPYIPVEAIERWNSLNPDKQAGYLAAAGAGVKEDMERQKQQVESDLAKAHAAYYRRALANGGAGMLTLSPQEQEAAAKAGVVPLRQSAGSFQYKEDPNNPVNMGTAPPTPILDPRDPSKIIGLQDAKGSVKYFPRPTSTEEFQNFMAGQGGAKAPVAAAPSATPIPATATVTVQTPAQAQALPPGTRYKTPDGRTYIR